MEEIPPSNSARTESPSSSNAELRLTTNHDDGVEVFIPLRERKRLLNKAINDSDHSSRARGTTDRVLPTARFLPLGQLLAQERNTTTAEQFEIPYYSLREDEDRKKHEINNNESDMIELKTMTGATTSLPVLKNYFFPDQAQNVITSSSPTQEGQEPRAKREKRLTLLQLTTSTNSSEKYCVVSQCYFPIEMFSQNHYVNYENLEMFKFVLSDVEDIEEYLAEFYKNNGVNVNEGGVATNLYVCDHVYTCIFNRHEHAMAKYRKLIKYFGLLDISTLNKRMKSYQLSCRDFMTNCLWILFMSIAYLLFIALLCISIWLVEGNYELELLRNSTTISGTNITTSYAGLNEVTFLKYHQPLIVTNENTNSTLGPTEYTLTNLPKWNYLSSFYFTSTTMLTIGYGDYSPSTIGGQFLVVIFAFFSLFLTTLVITAIGERFLSNTTSVLYIISHALMRIIRIMIIKVSLRNKLKNVTKALTSPIAQLVYLCVFILLYIIFGSLIFFLLEDSKGDEWTFWTAIYFAVVTLTTIGYGDIYVRHQMSKVVLVVFVLFGVGFLAVLFTKLLEVITPAMTTLIHRKASQQREKLFKLFKERHKSKSP